jgi:uncharacterized membrane protein YhaH (DUF805 family)
MEPFNSQQTTAPQVGIFSGRIGRLGFLLGALYPLLLLVGMMLIYAALSFTNQQTASADELLPTQTSPIVLIVNSVLFLVGAIVTLLTLPISLSLHVRRWHDLDQSGWMTTLAFVPLVGAIASLVLLFAPGTRGSNRYGSMYSGSKKPINIYGLK